MFLRGGGVVALGRAWTLLGSRENSKPEKCLKTAQNPQRPVHALLGIVLIITKLNFTGNIVYLLFMGYLLLLHMFEFSLPALKKLFITFICFLNN
jgi:hypothetical protein